MRAQFEVRPLDVNAGDVYPEEAIRCSSAAIDMLNVLHGEAEDSRNARESFLRDSWMLWFLIQCQSCQTAQCIHVTCRSGDAMLNLKTKDSQLF